MLKDILTSAKNKNQNLNQDTVSRYIGLHDDNSAGTKPRVDDTVERYICITEQDLTSDKRKNDNENTVSKYIAATTNDDDEQAARMSLLEIRDAANFKLFDDA